VGDWGLVAKRVLCYEHPDPGNIHCHLLLTGVYVTTQNLKDTMWAHGVPCKGSGQLTFSRTFKDKQTDKKMEITDETIPKYISYMSKGKYDPKYVQGYDEETLVLYKSQWVTFTKEPPSYQLFKRFEASVRLANTNPTLKEITTHAHIFTMDIHKSHTPQMRKEQSQLIDDYCYYHKIQKEYRLPYQPF
jgi:hypothetical protein